MNILHVHTTGRKLDTLEQLEIYKHTKTNKNDILNEQTQFKSHALFEPVSYTHLDVYKRQRQRSRTAEDDCRIYSLNVRLYKKRITAQRPGK